MAAFICTVKNTCLIQEGGLKNGQKYYLVAYKFFVKFCFVGIMSDIMLKKFSVK